MVSHLEELNNKKEDEMVEDVLLLLAKRGGIQLVPADYIFTGYNGFRGAAISICYGYNDALC